jgi:hypothetical protein
MRNSFFTGPFLNHEARFRPHSYNPNICKCLMPNRGAPSEVASSGVCGRILVIITRENVTILREVVQVLGGKKET